MIPKEIIAKAIEGGWKPPQIVEEFKVMTIDIEEEWRVFALDPTFWQALGRALGWTETTFKDGCDWFKNARHFHGIILTDGDTAAFWQSLLTSKE